MGTEDFFYSNQLLVLLYILASSSSASVPAAVLPEAFGPVPALPSWCRSEFLLVLDDSFPKICTSVLVVIRKKKVFL